MEIHEGNVRGRTEYALMKLVPSVARRAMVGATAETGFSPEKILSTLKLSAAMISRLGGGSVSRSPCIGVALAPEDGEDPSDCC